MPFYKLKTIDIDERDVLRSSGISPEKAEKKNGAMLNMCRIALERSRKLIDHRILYRILPVIGADEGGLIIDTGDGTENSRPVHIGGTLLRRHIPQATELVVILMTLGPRLEHTAIELTRTSTMEGYILDSVGGAALRYISNKTCSYFETLFNARGLKVSHPYDPGMEGWPVEAGQPEIFSVLNSAEAGVRLNEYFTMIPKKSMTMVIGAGKVVPTTRRSCDTCLSRNTCIYRRLNEDDENGA